MIGSKLKKFANANGLMVSHGVAYGNYRGFACTFSEGSGFVQVAFSTHYPDEQKKGILLNQLHQDDPGQYQLDTFCLGEKVTTFNFRSTGKVMDRIEAFLNWFLPLLQASGATGWNTCAQCGGIVTAGRWFLIGGVAHYFHDSCAQSVTQDIRQDEQATRQQGSYLTGLLGAFLGASLGAIVWALILLAGFVASIVGLLIGWLADKGYDLLKGKQGKGKVVILILAVIFGVLAGTVASDVITLIGLINDGDMFGMTYGDIPAFLLLLFTEDPEYRSATLSNIGMGLLFAAIGVFALLRKTGQNVSGTKIIELT